MPIRPSQPPEASQRELARQLNRMNQQPAVRNLSEGTLGAPEIGGAPSFRSAYRSYSLSPAEILVGVRPGNESFKAWRYEVNQPRGAATAEVLMDAQGGHRLTQVVEGSHSTATHELIGWLSEQPDLGNDTFELRSLAVPALRVDSLWLHNESRPQDWFAVAHSLNPVLTPRRLYDAGSFFAALRQLAERHQRLEAATRE